MNKFVLIALTIFSGFASAYSDEAILDAKEMVKIAKDQFAVGEVTRVDVAHAEKFLLDMKFKAGKIAKADYCREVIGTAETIVVGILEEERVGQRTMLDVLTAKSELHRIKAECK